MGGSHDTDNLKLLANKIEVGLNTLRYCITGAIHSNDVFHRIICRTFLECCNICMKNKTKKRSTICREYETELPNILQVSGLPKLCALREMKICYIYFSTIIALDK